MTRSIWFKQILTLEHAMTLELTRHLVRYRHECAELAVTDGLFKKLDFVAILAYCIHVSHRRDFSKTLASTACFSSKD